MHEEAVHRERFLLVRQIGEGATSRVFEVLDRRTGGRFALKRLRREPLSAGSIASFKDEFRAIERMSHPNLAKIHELIADGTRLSILMELVEAVSFLRYVRPDLAPLSVPRSASRTRARVTGLETRACDADDTYTWTLPSPAFRAGSRQVAAIFPPLPEGCEGRLREVLAQLVDGLRYLHARGMAHCDIKPENVLVTSEGRVVIVDFGLLTHVTEDQRSRGTPAFMAPEQFRGTYGPAVDCYAVGALLAATLAGHPRAFEESNPVVWNGLPGDLVALGRALVSHQPARRPSMEMVARSMGLAVSPAAAHASFLGRARELAELSATFACSRAGALRVVHVMGESGIGKSALLGKFADVAAAGGATVFRGTCYRDAAVPYKGVDAIFDRIAEHLERAPPRLGVNDRDDIATMFPVLGAVPARMEQRKAEREKQSDRIRGVRALRRLLESLAKDGLVLILDDMQWSDTESLDLLGDVMQDGMLLLLAYRSAAGSATTPIHDALSTFRRDATLWLQPLDDVSLLEMAGASLRREEACELARESAGNPFFMGELLRARVEASSIEALTVTNVVARRVARLDARARAYLELAAVAGRPVAEALLRDALGLAQDEALKIRHTLVAESFLRAAAGASQAVEVYHDRIREHLAEDLVAAEKRSLHSALAAAYAGAGADHDVLAAHYRGAGDSARAAYHCERAADTACESFAFDHAASCYAAALDILNAEPHLDGDRLTLRAKLAAALSSAGRPQEAAQVYQQLLDQAPGDLDLLMCTGDELLKCGRAGDGLQLLGKAARRLGESLPASSLGTLVRLLWYWLLIDRAPLRLRPDHLIDAPTKRRLTFCLTLSRQLIWLDYQAAGAFSLRHLRLALAAGSRTDIVEGLGAKAAFVSATPPWLTGGVARAERILNEARSLVTAADPSTTLGSLRFSDAAAVEFAHGRWSGARKAFDEALEILRDNAAPRRHWNITFGQCGIIENLRAQGDIEAIRARLQEFRAETKGHRILEAFHALRGGVLVALWDDDVPLANSVVEEAMRQWPRRPIRMPHYFEAVARTEIALYARDTREASRHASEARTLLKRSGLHQNSNYFIHDRVLRARVELASGHFRAGWTIRGIRRRREPWAQATGAALEAARALGRRPAQRAIPLLQHALALTESCDLWLYRDALGHRLAELTPGSHNASAAGCRPVARARFAAFLLPVA